jgi:hypothetical protein
MAGGDGINNGLFGDALGQYDETLCSGADAGPGFRWSGFGPIRMTIRPMMDEAGLS